jgi:membrane protein implicated in regulation of membrane protease activity
MVFAGMVYLLCVSGADLMRGISKERCINIALVPLGFMAVGSVALLKSGSSWASYQGISSRFKGAYSDSIVAGQMFGLTCLLLSWSILHTRSKKVWGYWALLSIAILCLVLTRTRTDVFATVIGIIACLFATMCSSTTAIPRRRARVILGLLVLILVISSIWLTRPGIDTSRATEHLRLTGGYEGVLESRAEYWWKGTGNLSVTNIFGEGPLAKFGGELSTESSTYDRELNVHNAFLSVFQSYGWPGGILFIIFLVSVGGTFLKRKDPYAVLGLSLLAFGLVQSISENWLLSFGTPLDAYSWFILGLTLTHNSSISRFEIADNRCKSY